MKRPPLSLKAQALALLARREHSRQELRSKLLAHARKLAAAQDADTGAQADDLQAWPQRIDAVLDELQTLRYLSDERFAEARVHARAAGQGQARIRQELARHGVALPEELASSLRQTEQQRARALWQRRFGSVSDDPRERARQMRFLAARGFSAEVVRQITGRPEDPESLDDPAVE